MSDYRFQVHLGGMIEVLSDHLYSSPDVYIRELLQNAVDAIVARKKHNGADSDYKGNIYVYLEGNTLRFVDNGIGLTEEEIHQFLAIIGESSKKQLEDGQLRSDYIGRFGIGLLSCFIVSNEIKVITRSVKSDRAYVWIGKPDGMYELTEYDKEHDVGTEIILSAKAGSELYFKSDVVRDLLIHYGIILPYPIYFSNEENKIRLNPVELPWEKDNIDKQELMLFGKVMFQQDFLDCVVIESKTGEAKGVAYILDYPVQASTRQEHRIYLKNMLLTEKGENIFPEWAFFTKCIINTYALRPTASREGFYVDDVLETTRKELGKCIFDYLADLAQNNKYMFRKFMDIHDLAIRSMAVSDDEMFDLFINEIDFSTSKGFMTGRELKSCGEDLLYADMEEYRQLSQIFTAQNKLLINIGYVYSRQLLEKLSICEDLLMEKVNEDFIDDMLMDISPAEAENCVNFLKTAERILKPFQCDVEMKQYIPMNLPAFYYIDEKAIRSQNIKKAIQLSDDLFAGVLENFAQNIEEKNPCIYFNLRNPIIKKMVKSTNEHFVEDIIMVIYVQTLLIGGFSLHNNELGIMNERLLSIFEHCMDE